MNDRPATNSSCTLVQARAAKEAAQGVFARLATVAGIGVTRVGRGYGLKINVATAPTGKRALPSEVQGVPVKIEVVGTIRKRAA